MQCNKNVLSILREKDERKVYKKILQYSNVLQSEKKNEDESHQPSKLISFRINERRQEVN